MDREKLTFAQAELAEPLPTQLLRTEISDQLTSLLWVVIHDSLQKSLRWSDAIYADLALYQPWDTILRQWRNCLGRTV